MLPTLFQVTALSSGDSVMISDPVSLLFKFSLNENKASKVKQKMCRRLMDHKILFVCQCKVNTVYLGFMLFVI